MLVLMHSASNASSSVRLGCDLSLENRKRKLDTSRDIMQPLEESTASLDRMESDHLTSCSGGSRSPSKLSDSSPPSSPAAVSPTPSARHPCQAPSMENRAHNAARPHPHPEDDDEVMRAERERSPARPKLTAFSVLDILDPNKFIKPMSKSTHFSDCSPSSDSHRVSPDFTAVSQAHRAGSSPSPFFTPHLPGSMLAAAPHSTSTGEHGEDLEDSIGCAGELHYHMPVGHCCVTRPPFTHLVVKMTFLHSRLIEKIFVIRPLSLKEKNHICLV